MTTRPTARLRQRTLLAGLLSAGTAVRAAPAPIDPLLRPARPAPRALGALMLGVARAGRRLVAVGERGTVLLSEDGGGRWTQIECPVSCTLTAVRFADERTGWAVGHAGAVLHTQDGGSRWTLQFDGRHAAAAALQAARVSGPAALVKQAERAVEDGADKPWLDLWVAADGQRAIAVGAFGQAIATHDGGRQWASLAPHLPNPKGLHLNAVHHSGHALWIAGEQGLLLRSADDGATWSAAHSPYGGSWFALTSTAGGDEQVVVAGLRGQVWFGGTAGFQRSEVPAPITVSAAGRGTDGTLLLVNQAGQVLASRDQGRSFRPLAVPPGPPATSLLALDDGSFVATTFAGPARWPALR